MYIYFRICFILQFFDLIVGSYIPFYFFKDFIHLREHEVEGRGAEGEGEANLQLSRDPGVMDQAKVRCLTDRATQAPPDLTI